MAGADSLRLCVIGDGGSVHVQGRARPFAERGFALEMVEATPPPGPAALLRLARHLARCPADLVHIHYAASIAAWLWVALGRDLPTVLTVMGGDILDEEQMPLPGPARWMTRQVTLRADRVTAKTDHLSQRLLRMGVTPASIVKLIWGVDRQRFHRGGGESVRQALGLAPGDRLILSPRILRPFYNIHVLVEALPAILATVPTARLALTEYRADPEYRAALAARADALGVGHALVWAGTVAQADMPALYSAADLVVGIPPSDGFPQTLLEAMACGAPCIVTDLDRTREVVEDGVSALLVSPEPAAVAAAAIRLLGDAALAARLAETGPRLVAERADLARDLDRVAALYGELARHGCGTPRPWWVRLGIWGMLLGWTVRNAVTGRR